MIALTIIVLVLIAVVAGAAYLLGFQLAGRSWQSELLQVRQQAAQAERQLHQLTVAGFEAMAEEVERRRHGGQ